MTARARLQPAGSWRWYRSRGRVTIALALLVSLSTAGLAHATRLCGLSGHRAASPAALAHCGGEHREHAAPAQHPAEQPAERPGPPRSACCAGGTSLAAIPAAKVHGAAGTIRALADGGGLAVLGTSTMVARTLVAPALPWSARDPGSGLRHHLVQRVLLI